MLRYCHTVVRLLYMHWDRPAGCRDAAPAASPATPRSSGLGRQRPSPPWVVVVVVVVAV